MSDGDKLNFTVGAREIYDEVKGLRSDVRHAIDDYAGLKDKVSRLEKVVYGLVPIVGIAGGLVGKFWM